MDPMQLRETFISMKMHWDGVYDFMKYKGKLKHTNRIDFDQSPDRNYCIWLSEKFPKKSDFVMHLIPLFLKKDITTVREVYSEETKRIALDWHRNIQKMPDTFREDCKTIIKHLRDHDIPFSNFFKGEGIIDFLVFDKISIESFIILNKILKFLDKSKYNSIIYNITYRKKIERYSIFITVNEEKYKFILEKVIKEAVMKR